MITGLVSAGQLQPKGGLMAQADRLGPEVGCHLVLWAAFISPRPCNDSVSRVVLRRVRNCRSYYYYYRRLVLDCSYLQCCHYQPS